VRGYNVEHTTPVNTVTCRKGRPFFHRCNLKKGPNIASTDPEAGRAYRIVPLFHPRHQHWQEHFHLREDGRIEGVTPEGHATVRLLDFNAEERVQLRRLLMRQGWRP